MRNQLDNLQAPRQQQGVVLVTALVFLVILTLLGITAMSTNTLDERMASNSQDLNRAFQAAESGITKAFFSAGTFAGTTTGFTSAGSHADLGVYKSDLNFNSNYSGSSPISFTNINSAASAGTFKYHYFNVESTSTLQSRGTEMTNTVGAGARVIGT